MMSHTAEYALRAVVWLAHEADHVATAQAIAEATHVPAGYLSKVLQVLGRSDIVRSRRGINGGYTLAKPADTMTVLDVIEAVEPPRRVSRCPLAWPFAHPRRCALHRHLDAAVSALEHAFGDTTIAAVVLDVLPDKARDEGSSVPDEEGDRHHVVYDHTRSS